MVKKIFKLKGKNNVASQFRWDSSTGILKVRQHDPFKKGIGKFIRSVQIIKFKPGTQITKVHNPKAGILEVTIRKRR